ncbi:O-antigen ligase family protein [Polaribacter sp. BAL334]|uniref:O-antigen ligase family protein n=1 Tax=Polaribacter sp. BAL334 TaxID=1708178 RepID=UPI0018D26817|nr:O-antigen ligase family protein [Polaribacter sp. BAL334]MBG7611507.1 O-antigen ligase family protein [Polaribacter sp. BAL334]
MVTINKYQALFGFITFLIIQFSIFELHFGIYVLTSFICFSTISKNVINLISYIIILLIIAGISSIFQKPTLYDFIKDFAYFTKPIIALIAGYLLAKKIADFSSFLRTFIYVVCLLSVFHIFNIFLNVDFSQASVTKIRTIGGISNLSEVIALTIIIASYRIQFLDVIKNKLLKKVILSIIFLSFFLYFSRTMFVSLGLFLLAIFGYLKITSKGLKYGFLALSAFLLFYVYLFNANLERDKPGLESFLYKLKIAPSEIFTPIRTVDPNNHAYLWDHWRAYEATLAIDQINTPVTFLIGKGLGALVDLKFKVYLGDSEMRYIPMLHNGFVLVFFKTGIIGFFIYLLFLINMYLFAYAKITSEKTRIINNLISGFGVYFIFSSLIISGIYNIEDFYMFIVGTLLFFRKEAKINLIEE